MLVLFRLQMAVCNETYSPVLQVIKFYVYNLHQYNISMAWVYYDQVLFEWSDIMSGQGDSWSDIC